MDIIIFSVFFRQQSSDWFAAVLYVLQPWVSRWYYTVHSTWVDWVYYQSVSKIKSDQKKETVPPTVIRNEQLIFRPKKNSQRNIKSPSTSIKENTRGSEFFVGTQYEKQDTFQWDRHIKKRFKALQHFRYAVWLLFNNRRRIQLQNKRSFAVSSVGGHDW